MRRIQIRIDDDLDAAVTSEAALLGVSKAAFIRACLRRQLQASPPSCDPAWEAMIGWLGDDVDPVESVDDVVYGTKSAPESVGEPATAHPGATGVLDPKALETAWTAADLARFSRESPSEPGAKSLSEALAELREDER